MKNNSVQKNNKCFILNLFIMLITGHRNLATEKK